MDPLNMRHDCRNDEKCPRIEWHVTDMRGASDFTVCTFNVQIHANITNDGWESQRHLPTMVLTAAVCELHSIVRGLLHEGSLFAGADDVHVWAVRVA